MNFYKHYIGDFQRDTGHLSLTERGAYLALIHHYYATENPLPKNLDSLCRIAGAVTKAEREAVKSVTSFFEPMESGLVHSRIEAEIEKAGAVSNTNREIAIKREAKRRSEREAKKNPPIVLPDEHDKSTLRAKDVPPDEHDKSTNQTPDSIHQEYSNKTHTNPENVGEPSMQGRVCVELQKMGIMHVNPCNPELIELIEKGLSINDFIAAGIDAVNKSNFSFNYVMGIVRNRKQQALEKQKSQSNPSRLSPGSTKNNNSRGNYDRNQHEKQSDTHSLFAEKYAHFIEA
jgi:uncharacterized protein YdaU (DUF1376 family)